MNFGRTLFAAMVTAAVVAAPLVSGAHSVDEEAVRKYVAQKQKENNGAGMRDYRTPAIYAAPDSLSMERPRPPQPDSVVAPSSALRPFGYDVFAAPNSEFFAPSQSPVPENYVLGPGDNVILNLWGRVEKSYELTVDREGKVFIPTCGEVTLWGLTVAQGEAKLRTELSRIYTDFQLSIVLGKIRSIKVYVFGAVKKPGAYTVSGLSTLFNVLYMSGGPDDGGSLRRIQLSRDGRNVATVDLYDVLIRGRNVDTRLVDNDVIFVPVVEKTASIRGRVRRPAIYELMGSETVGDLLGLAGGPKADAYLQKLVVRRIEANARHVVINVNLSEASDSTAVALRNGDSVDVFSIYDSTERYVEITGKVKYSGKYEYRDGMRLSDLIDNQLVRDSYVRRANILRTRDDMSKTLLAVDLSAVTAGDTLADIALQERDVLTVYSRADLRRVPYVSIEGEVNHENSFEVTEGMRLSDVVFLAGGLRKSAWVLYAEIARVGSRGYSDILRVNLEEVLSVPGGKDDLALMEDDRIFVREIPEWSLQDLVMVEGEVRFPGRYALRHRNEKLSDLVERAGGFTDDAFLRGAVFERPSIASDIERRNIIGIMENLQEVTTDSTMLLSQSMQRRSLASTNMRRIVVDLVELFETHDAARDIELRGGDRIYIPPVPSGVHVLGAVASGGTIKYQPGESYKYYLRGAGGLVKSADHGEIRVVRPDGHVFKGGLSHVKIEIGDSIVVPKKISEPRDWWKVVTSSVTIVTSAVTMVYLMTHL